MLVTKRNALVDFCITWCDTYSQHLRPGSQKKLQATNRALSYYAKPTPSRCEAIPRIRCRTQRTGVPPGKSYARICQRPTYIYYVHHVLHRPITYVLLLQEGYATALRVELSPDVIAPCVVRWYEVMVNIIILMCINS
jgi:hypothetical protein